MASKSGKSPVIWVLMGLLILGLGGFGATSFGGGIRSIGSVGQVDIPTNDYFNGLQQAINVQQAETGQAVQFSDLQAAGVSERVLAQLVAQAAFDNEARDIGISVGDENLRKEILSMQQFQGVDGSFDESLYRLILDRSGESVSQFERGLRADAARSILQASVLAGIKSPKPYTDAMLTYLSEQRDVSWDMLDANDITTGLPVPGEAELKAYYDENPDQFTAPESKRISYAWLSPDMIIDTVEVDEDSLRAAYEEASEEFNQPERRLVERLVFTEEANAQAALDRITSEETTFEDVVGERGLELSDIDLGDVTFESMGDIANVIFGSEVGEVVGPLQTDLGPALFRINAALAEQITSFEDAQADLRSELAADRARRVVDQSIDTVDDLLAGGATIEDLSKETDMQTGQIDYHEGLSDGIAAYPGFRRAAAELTADDYPEVAQLDDGSIFAMQLEEVIPAALQPFEEVRDAVEDAWRQTAIVDALTTKAEPLADKLSNGEGFTDLSLSVDGSQSLSRARLTGETPADFVETVFAMEEGEARIIPGEGRIFLIKLDKVSQPEADDEDAARLKGFIENDTGFSISQDLYAIVADALREAAGVDLDYTAINAVHTNFN